VIGIVRHIRYQSVFDVRLFEYSNLDKILDFTRAVKTSTRTARTALHLQPLYIFFGASVKSGELFLLILLLVIGGSVEWRDTHEHGNLKKAVCEPAIARGYWLNGTY